ncbi:hypothetical protein ACHHYP_07997 [Achlya hypogyna]|uniref:Uncharacterized protein n=1 Tax=Achlya hypogyna TaxID=1202772 RepID=A0A1V9YQ87_ACHHY|nr:hypothetical protein ACHHYP_07997 [Achlya hypogyna]
MKVAWSQLEVLVVDEHLTSLDAIPELAVTSVQHLNVSVPLLTAASASEPLATALRVLNVNHNHLTVLRGIENLRELRTLKCAYNRIEGLAGVLNQLVQLEELWLHHNRLELWELRHLRDLEHLQTLVLEPNPCCKEPALYVVSLLPSLRRLDASTVTDDLRQRAAAFRQSHEGRAFERQLQAPTAKRALPVDAGVARAFPANAKVENNDGEGTPEVKVPRAPLAKAKKPPPKFDVESYPIQEYMPSTAAPVTDLSVLSIADAIGNLPVFEAPSKPTKAVAKPGAKVVAKKPVAPPPEVDADPFTDAAIDDDNDIVDLAPVLRPTASPVPPVQIEWSVKYPGTTVTAIVVRPDGSALARWPNGAIATTVDRDADGRYRVFGTFKDGSVALSFDGGGVGFVNYASGKTMLSTTATGDGLFLSPDNGAIVDQWGPGKAWRGVARKLSDHVGVGVEVQASGFLRVDVYLVCNHLRARLTNGYNLAVATGDDCSALFGKPVAAKKKAAPPKLPHADLVSEIRAAAARLP